MALLKATITIQGERPLLFHSFSVDSIPLEKKEQTGVAGNDPEEWKRSVLKTADNQLFVHASYIFGCLRDGGKHIKSGRGNIQSKIAATLIVHGEIILLDRFVPPENELPRENTAPVYLDIRSVKNPATKGKNVRYRIAASPGWKAVFTIEWENTVVSRNEMRSVLDSAGSLVGIGDGRSIGMGRFKVLSFDIDDSGSAPVKKKK